MKLDLKRYFLLNNLVTATLPIVCVGLISLQIVKSHLLTELDSNGFQFARSLVSQITTYLKEPVATFSFITKHLVDQGHSGADRAGFLDQLAESYDYFDALYLLDSQGTVQQAGFKDERQKNEGDYQGMNFSQVEICRQALQDNRLHWAPSVSISSGEPTMSFCAPLNGGTLLADLKLSNLGRIINEANSGNLFTAFIVDRTGRIIAHPDPEIARQKENIGNLPLIKSALAGPATTGMFSFHNIDYRGTAIQIPELGWVLVVSQDVETVMRPVKTMQRVLVSGIFGTVALALFLSYIGSRFLRRPFKQLTQHAQQVIREDYEGIKPIDSRFHEISILSETLCRMVESIRTREALLNTQTKELVASEEMLRELNQHLEDKIAERTAKLEETNNALAILNEDLLQRGRALEDANRQLESFAYSVSHDLRAPLRHAGSFAAILLEDHSAQLSEEGKRLAERVVAGCRRMGELIDAILKLSRVASQTITKVTVSTGKLLDAVIAECKDDLAGRSVELIVGTLPNCKADAQLLQQVWANLLGNAIKYTRHRQHAVIEIGAKEESGETVYFVRDNGAGFDMTHAERLFGVFQRFHSAAEFEGNGLGLAIVSNIINRHGGRIWADAKRDEGATFWFTLPA
jgi:signal transduction histidine kinase